MNTSTSTASSSSQAWRQARRLIQAGLLSFGGAFLAGNPLSAMAAATLYVVQGSGDMQSLQTAVSVTAPQAFTMFWTTDQAGAAGGTWKVTNTSTNQVVATGEATPAPAVGKALNFTIPQNAFLQSSGVSVSTKYHISIQPHNGVMQAMGTPSANVAITQVPSTTTPPIVFGDNANFPLVEIVSYTETNGVLTSSADLVLRVTNKSRTTSDPAWLRLKDANALLRHNTSALAVPSLLPNASVTFNVRMDAILPPPTPQMPQVVQHQLWKARHADVCGPVLSSVLDWRGPVSQAPMGDHLEKLIVKEGWSDYAKVSPNTPICDGNQCVKVCQIEKNIKAQLDGRAMGYAFMVGSYPKFGAGGKARNAADSPETAFRSDTKITVASVSKLVTAIAAVRLIDRRGTGMPQGLDTPIAAFLPSDWNVQSDFIRNMTFAQLLSQRSGIKDYGNVRMDYETLRKFFTQDVDTTASTACQGSDVQNPADPVNTMDTTPCYSNYNFAIMRVLLPRVAGFAEDPNPATRPATLANQFMQVVRQNVFNLVGQADVSCRPPANSTNYAFAYKWASSTEKGSDFGDMTDVCGAASMYLSVEDMAKVMLSLQAGDGKILPATIAKDLYRTMRQRGLGWDVVNQFELEKNGGWAKNCNESDVCDNISTSVAQFGPIKGPKLVGVLFINSNITGGGGAKEVLEKAYFDAIYTK